MIKKKDLEMLQKIFGKKSIICETKANFDGCSCITSFSIDIPIELEEVLYDGADVVVIHPKRK
jgi:hypothetical protein